MTARELRAMADLLRLATPTLPMRHALRLAAGVRTLTDLPRPGCAAALTEVCDIAQSMGVRPNTISMILTGKNWAHLKEVA